MLHDNKCAVAKALNTEPPWLLSLTDSNFDGVILYLSARLTADAGAIENAGQPEQIILLRRITAYAQAMAVIPARGWKAIAAKLHAANWSLDQGSYCLRLASELASELIASAGRDKTESDIRQL